MAQPAYPNPLPLPLASVLQRLAQACAAPQHAFWADDVSMLDEDTADITRVHGLRQLTDIYLLALAAKHGGRFVTFDGGIPVAAARQAKSKNLLVL